MTQELQGSNSTTDAPRGADAFGQVGNPTHKALPAMQLPSEAPRSRPREVWDRFRRNKLAMLCFVIVAIYLLVGMCSFSPLFDRKINDSLAESYEPPAWRSPDGHIEPQRWLGLDIQGRSFLWRALYGTRIALLITIITSIIAISIGVILGIVAGYFGGWLDDIIIWLYSTVSSIPWLLLVIALAYVIQSNDSPGFFLRHERLQAIFGGVTTVILAMGLTDWVGLCRLIRGEVIKLRDRDFVAAARAMGLGNGPILFRHILPNTTHLIIITFSLGAVGYVQVEVVLAFLGLGITDKPSWGRMIDDAKLELLRGVWWQATAATAMIFVLCLALNMLGDFLRDALDPRLRGVDS